MKKFFNMHIVIEVKDESGNVIEKRREEAHSLTRNAYNFLFSIMSLAVGDDSSTFGAGYLSGKTKFGTVTSDLNYRAYNYTSNDGLIVKVGTGNTAFSVEDYELATICPSEDMLSDADTIPIPFYDSGDTVWIISFPETFSNISGGTINVKEVGLYLHCEMFSSGDAVFLIARDVLATPVDVLNGHVLSITYQVELDYSSID